MMLPHWEPRDPFPRVVLASVRGLWNEAGGRRKDVCLILEGSEPSEGQSSLWVSVFILQRERHATRTSGDISAFEFLGL